ncbi:hypothetical protein [Owenweeksia hongkongensis]|uniref:hypothetical protein n=1 Tax=Owenweeksia hongkongensis TaxID=253245 RepID=UPI003A94D58B
MTLKEKVIQKIEDIEDPDILEMLDKWLEDEQGLKAGFSIKEISEVGEGYEQYKAGKVLSQQEAQQQLEAWLKGK